MSLSYDYKALIQRINVRLDEARELARADDVYSASLQAQKVYSGAEAGIDRLAAEVRNQGRELLASEHRLMDQFEKLRQDSRRILEVQADDERRQAEELRNEAHEVRAAQLRSAEKYGGTKMTSIVTGREARTYRPDGEHSFFSDVVREARGDWQARERLERHRRESAGELRASSTGDLGALVPPQFLPERYAKVLRAGRPTANQCMGLPLPPEGMSLTVPRGNTGSVVAGQTSENSAVASETVSVVDLDIAVNTYAGLVDVSRQSLDRGRMTDDIIFRDLAADYARQLNADVINGPGTGGRHLGILSTTDIGTVTSSTATVKSVWSQIANAAQQVASNRFEPPTRIIMHPRRWGWFVSQTDTEGRPLIDVEQSAQNVMGQGSAPGEGVVGTMQGLPVVLDAGIPTTLSTETSNEDTILVTLADDLLLWEENGGTPMQVRFDETLAGQLTSKLVLWSYSAFTAGWHPESTVVLQGAGLITPTF